MTQKLMTESEVAAEIGMSIHWLRRMRWAGGGIPYIKMNPQSTRGAVRYRQEDVLHYCVQNQRRSTSE